LIEIGARRRSRADTDCFVGGADSQRIPVGLTVGDDGADPELVAGTYDTDGDFATVRDENLAEHRPLSLQIPQLYAQSIP
jgi:hypothetical protein